jgi:hypothetical protein
MAYSPQQMFRPIIQEMVAVSKISGTAIPERGGTATNFNEPMD